MSELRGSPIDINPSISLQAGAGLQQPTSLLSGNPISTMTGFANIQNLLNQNRLFQQTFAARQMAGEITASSPDMETAMQRIAQSPAAPFMGEFMNQIRQTNLALTQQQGAQQQQAHSVFDGLMKGLPALYNNPGQWDAVTQSALSLTPPGPARQMAASSIDSIRQGLMAGVDPSSPTATQQFQKNLHGWLLASNMSPEMFRQTTGEPAPSFQILTGPQEQKFPAIISPGGVASPVTMGGAPGGGMAGMGGSTGAGVGPNRANSPLAGSPIVGPTATQSKYLTDRGTDMAAYQQHLDSNVEIGGTIQQTLTEARNAMANFRPGGGASTYTQIAQFAQALGANQTLVDKIGNGNLGASVEFQKLMVNTTMGQIREQLAGVGASRLSQMEFQAFNKNNPNIDTDPRAINKIFNFWTQLYGRDRQEQAGLNQYLATPGADISKWPAIWQATAQQRGYIAPTVDASGNPTPKVTTPTLQAPKDPPTTTTSNPLTRPPLSQFIR